MKKVLLTLVALAVLTLASCSAKITTVNFESSSELGDSTIEFCAEGVEWESVTKQDATGTLPVSTGGLL